MSIFDDAIKFAVDAHSGMTRRGCNSPYILHPMEVASIVGTITDDAEVLAAAVLHDTVEDTDTTIEDIKKVFGERVAELVSSETENKRPDIPPSESWQIRKKESLEELENSSDIAVKILWLADKLSNMRSFYEIWKEKGDALWQDFNQSDPAKQAWYYRTVDKHVHELENYEAYKEYHRLVEAVFSNVK